MSTVGILGAGQLGRMLALAGYPLGLRFRFFDPAFDAPAAWLAEQVRADYTDENALQQFAKGIDLVTYEFENVSLQAAQYLNRFVPVYPPPRALEAAQDRLSEKILFQELGIPTPGFAALETPSELGTTLQKVGLPAVLKTRRFGYDGKWQAVLRNPEDAAPAWQQLGGAPLVLESWVPFQRELSILACRGQDGATVFYPLVENYHREGILRLSVTPAREVSPELQRLAESYALALMERLDYVGVLAIELFEVGRELLANEMAPRVHNSGHWTIEGAETSQFANHLRAVLGWPLGSTAVRGWSAMINLVGSLPEPEYILALPGVFLHLYDKACRPGRKLGHITVCAPTCTELKATLAGLQKILQLPELDLFINGD